MQQRIEQFKKISTPAEEKKDIARLGKKPENYKKTDSPNKFEQKPMTKQFKFAIPNRQLKMQASGFLTIKYQMDLKSEAKKRKQEEKKQQLEIELRK